MSSIGSDDSSPTIRQDDAGAGDVSALWRLSEALRPKLRAVAVRQIADDPTAKVDPSDVVQDSLLAAHQSIEGFRGRTLKDWEAWLGAIVRRQAMNALRFWRLQRRDGRSERPIVTERGSTPLPVACPTPSGIAMNGEALERLERILIELPSAERTAIGLRYLEGRTVSEVASEMGRTELGVAGLLKRGLQRLRADLARDRNGPV